MGYRDSFYMLQNCVGFTGILNENKCSVYFKHPTLEIYGRITVGHKKVDNNGRSKPKRREDYVRKNMWLDDNKSRLYLNLGRGIRLRKKKLGIKEPSKFSDKRTKHHTSVVQVEFNKGKKFHYSRSEFRPLDTHNTIIRAQVARVIAENTKVKPKNA